MEYDNYKPRRTKKPMTEQQALLKLTTLCTQSEHCSQEMLDKMKKWELPEDAIARNMEFLIQKKFVDDERFAKYYEDMVPGGAVFLRDALEVFCR